MASFRCGRCAGAVRAADAESGRVIACPRCGHANICPGRSLVRPRPVRPRSARADSTAFRITVAAVLLAGVGWVSWMALDVATPAARTVAPAEALTPAEVRQRELLRQNVHQPGDPELTRLYGALNARHFSGLLPDMPVRWEPRLAEVGALAGESFVLEGMFGHIDEQTAILLNTNLQADEEAIRRALSHEMVHAYLYTIGDRSTNHGPAFRATLARLSTEGAFSGVVADEGERLRLRAWLETEAARLDRDGESVRRESASLAEEAQALEREAADLNAGVQAAGPGDAPLDRETVAAFYARRDAYNRRVADANARADRLRVALAEFNLQVERYNLMLWYPDGIDEADRFSPRSDSSRSGQTSRPRPGS